MRLEVQRTDHSYERVDGTFTTHKSKGKESQYIFFAYTNEIDLRHPIIEYFTSQDHQFDEVINEIAKRQITQIVISSSWIVSLNQEMLTKLFNDEFVGLGTSVFQRASRPKVVGYIVDQCKTVNDCEAMNIGLDLMLYMYSKKHNFNNIKDFRKDSYIVYPSNMRRVDD